MARHYDDLDRFYRELWGEHVHHGVFDPGVRDAHEAADRLVELVAERARVEEGSRVLDVGCGYGATARELARRRGAEVTGVTVSEAQHRHALRTTGDDPRLSFVLGDWLAMDPPGSSFDAVLAVESTEHMADKAEFFRRAREALRPGGRAVVCAWLSREAPPRWQVRALLEPICREGRLPGLATEREYRALVAGSGLALESMEDLTERVRRTWTVCAGALVRGLVRRPDYRRFALDRRQPNRVFALTVFRMWGAYRVGALRYGLLVARRP